MSGRTTKKTKTAKKTKMETTAAVEAPSGALTRRNLLGLAALGVGGGAVLAAQPVAGVSAATAIAGTGIPTSRAAAPAAIVPAPTEVSGLTPFPQQPDLNFQAQFNYGEAAYGAAEVGEVATGVQEVTAAMAAIDGQPLPIYDPYNATFEALAARLATEADAEKAAGRFVSARSKYLRAAGYYTGVLFFVLGTDAPTREAELYGAMQRCWAEAAALLQPVWTRVEIPMTVRFPDASGAPVARTVTVPAYWARAAGDGPKPTVIVNNGSDAQLVDTYAFGGAAALERGYNALMFEGPGQGSLLFEQDVPFTPYWEDVITPLVDFVLAQPETDRDAVALTGWSFGGLLVMRAAAFEHRIKAVVADPVFNDPTVPYDALKGLPNDIWVNDVYANLPAYGLGPERSQAYFRFLLNKRGEIFGQAFHAQALSGVVIQDIEGLLAAIGRYTADQSLFAQVTSHSLLLSYEYDTFFSGQDVTVKGWLTGAASISTHVFTEAEGAQFHCAPMAPQLRNEVVYDWLDEVFAHAPTPPAPPAPPVPPLPPAPAPAAGGGDGALAATGLDAGPIAAIAGGLATAGAGAAVLAGRLSAPARRR
ncbi:acetylxylan esterase [Herbiconiux sp. CPCC 205716]|uniref:Acetylxylan esterase n=1 Tax=Herbiconiux gentiana TaxID=2970912 RepID=A0ABT2GJ66_9MICO|nr:alpha/beta fold hydrolase [Herbiconiux gentiana]MCS5716261.1 acetylxylan esterase [Herbiconiux gentiana]